MQQACNKTRTTGQLPNVKRILSYLNLPFVIHFLKRKQQNSTQCKRIRRCLRTWWKEKLSFVSFRDQLSRKVCTYYIFVCSCNEPREWIRWVTKNPFGLGSFPPHDLWFIEISQDTKTLRGSFSGIHIFCDYLKIYNSVLARHSREHVRIYMLHSLVNITTQQVIQFTWHPRALRKADKYLPL